MTLSLANRDSAVSFVVIPYASTASTLTRQSPTTPRNTIANTAWSIRPRTVISPSGTLLAEHRGAMLGAGDPCSNVDTTRSCADAREAWRWAGSQHDSFQRDPRHRCQRLLERTAASSPNTLGHISRGQPTLNARRWIPWPEPWKDRRSA